MFADPKMRIGAGTMTQRAQEDVSFEGKPKHTVLGATLDGVVLSFKAGEKKGADSKPGPAVMSVLVTCSRDHEQLPAVGSPSPLGGFRLNITGKDWVGTKKGGAGGGGGGGTIVDASAPANAGALFGAGADANADPDAGLAMSFALPAHGEDDGASSGSSSSATDKVVYGFMWIGAGLVLQVKSFAVDFGKGQGNMPVHGDRMTFTGVRASPYRYEAFVSPTDGSQVPAGCTLSVMAESLVYDAKITRSMPRDLASLAEEVRSTAPFVVKPFASEPPRTIVANWPRGRVPSRTLAQWSEHECADEEFSQRVHASSFYMVRPGVALAPSDTEAQARAKCVENAALTVACNYGPLLIDESEKADDTFVKKTKSALVVKQILAEQPTCVLVAGHKPEMRRISYSCAFDACTAATAITDNQRYAAFMRTYGNHLRIAFAGKVDINETVKANANAAHTGALLSGTVCVKADRAPTDPKRGYVAGRYDACVVSNLASLVRRHGFAVSNDDTFLQQLFALPKGSWKLDSALHTQNMAHQVADAPVINCAEWAGNVKSLKNSSDFYVLFLVADIDSPLAALRARVAKLGDAAKAQALVSAALMRDAAIKALPYIVYAVPQGVGSVDPDVFDGVRALGGVEAGDDGSDGGGGGDDNESMAAEQTQRDDDEMPAPAQAARPAPRPDAGKKRAAPPPTFEEDGEGYGGADPDAIVAPPKKSAARAVAV